MRTFLMLTLSALIMANVRQPKLDHIDPSIEFPAIPNEYIVVFKPGTAQSVIDSHFEQIGATANIAHRYSIPNEDPSKEFKGYHMKVTDADRDLHLKALSQAEEVKSVEQNGVVKASFASGFQSECMLQMGATWGLVRTSQGKSSQPNGMYSYGPTTSGKEVLAYILDTGIATDNVDFEGRATWGADFANFPSPGTDLNGHGTHVAGTVIGKEYGLAKDTEAIAVAVLSASGSGTFAGIIQGIEWSVNDMKAKKKRAVANLSLGGGRSSSVNDAVNAAVDNGLPMIVAAGNSAYDACFYSPASAEKAFTVMSSTVDDELSYFSNYGSCTDIIAPGSAITSAWIGSTTAITTISGTSMASPHVAGVAAKMLSKDNLTVDQLYARLKELSLPGVISKVPSSSPNSLLHKECLE